MDEFDRADINAARGLRNQQQLWTQFKLATDDQLLLVAARKRSRRQLSIRRTHIKACDDFVSAPPNGRVIQENIAGIRRNRRSIVNAQNRILGQTEFQQQPAAMPVLRNVRDAQFTTRARIPDS